jgi:hypothetical protein
MSIRLRSQSPIPASSAPIDRRHLESFRKPIRALFGILFLGYTGYAIAIWVYIFLQPVMGETALFMLPLPAILGILTAFGIMVAEWYTAGTRWYWYAIPFVPDVWFTYVFTEPWVRTLAQAHLAAQPVLLYWITLGASFTIALVSARFGEILLFGTRPWRRT